MPSTSDTSDRRAPVSGTVTTHGRQFFSFFPRWPRNVYLLLLFTLGKGFQLSIAALTLNYYVHSLGYRTDFIGVFSAMASIGALLGSVPVAMVADRIGRKPVLLLTALLTPLSLALCAFATSAPLLLMLSLLQGLVATAYWVTNLPLLIESTTEQQRVGVLAVNTFLLLGVGALGNLLGGTIPEFVGGMLHVSASSVFALRWGVCAAALFTFVFSVPLWLLREPRRTFSVGKKGLSVDTDANIAVDTSIKVRERRPVRLFLQLLVPDLVFTMGEGAVVMLIQIYFVLRFQLQPGPLGVIFTFSGLVGGIFALAAPLFVKRWSKLRLVTTVQYISAPLMVLIGFAPVLPLAIAGEYTRSFLRTLIDPVYSAFAMEQVSDRYRARLAAFYSVTWSIGYSIGPTVGGWLQSRVSLSSSFVFGALCLLIAPTLLLLFFGCKSGPLKMMASGRRAQ